MARFCIRRHDVRELLDQRVLVFLGLLLGVAAVTILVVGLILADRHLLLRG